MPGFSIRNPYFIIVICLTLLVIGVTSLARMPVDLFPPINLARGRSGHVLHRHAAGGY